MIEVAVDDPRRADIAALIAEHLRDMHSTTPAESVHAIGVDALCHSSITLWSAREGDSLLGIGALKQLDASSGEIKSMRTPEAHRGRGIASRILDAILAEARRRGYAHVLLETGSGEAFAAARAFYARHGFVERGPFGEYTDDPNSTYMESALRISAARP